MPPKPKRESADLVAPPVFARILPKNVGGHVDDGVSVYKRLASWSDAAAPGDRARVTLADGHGETHYAFPKRVFGPEASQEELFRDVARPLLRLHLDANDPQSAFVFAYGQTGTGKTYTLMGAEESWETPKHEKRGLFPRVAEEVLATLTTRKETDQRNVASFAAHVSAVEFYFCQGFDLLDDHAQVRVEKGEILGAKQWRVESSSDVLDVLNTVRQKRTTASTKMNPATKNARGGSSRSHCALTLTTRVVDGVGVCRKATFVCMDLAGAERQSSNDNAQCDAMEAIMSYWRDPATGETLRASRHHQRRALVAAQRRRAERGGAPPRETGDSADAARHRRRELHDGGFRREVSRRERRDVVAGAQVWVGDVVRVHVRRRRRQAPHAVVGAICPGDADRYAEKNDGEKGAGREGGSGEDTRGEPPVLQVPRAAENRGEAFRARSRDCRRVVS
jgi:hypothetical protein